MLFRPNNSLAYLSGYLFLLLSAHKLLNVINLGAFRHRVAIYNLVIVLHRHVLHRGIKLFGSLDGCVFLIRVYGLHGNRLI